MKLAFLLIFFAVPALAQSTPTTAGHVPQTDAQLNAQMEKCRVDTNVTPADPAAQKPQTQQSGATKQ